MILSHSPNRKVILLLSSYVWGALSDFAYPDFNKTTGLVFNGAASATDCGEASVFAETEGADDDEVLSRIGQQGHTATSDLFSTVETAKHNSSEDEIAIHDAVFGHRNDFTVGLSTGCSTRLR